MTELAKLSASERASLTQELEQRYNAFKAQGLKLDMTRGKPSSEQLDLASKLTVALSETDYKGSDGSDGRNYGGLDGLPEMKAIFADMLGAPAAQVVVGGASTHGKGTVQSISHLAPFLFMRGDFVVSNPKFDPIDLGALKYTTNKFYRVTGSSTQWYTANLAIAFEQAEFDRACIGGEHCDVDPVTARAHAERFGFAV